MERIKNECSQKYSEVIDLSKIKSYKEYLVILYTNGFTVEVVTSGVYPKLYVKYNNTKHTVHLKKLVLIFDDMGSKHTNISKPKINFEDRYSAKVSDLKVGDILYQAYGEDCTLYNFFKVVKVRKSKAKIKELVATEEFSNYEETKGMTEPLDEFTPDDISYPIHGSVGKLYFLFDCQKVTDSGLNFKKGMRIYNGKPKHFNKTIKKNKTTFITDVTPTERLLLARGIL